MGKINKRSLQILQIENALKKICNLLNTSR